MGWAPLSPRVIIIGWGKEQGKLAKNWIYQAPQWHANKKQRNPALFFIFSGLAFFPKLQGLCRIVDQGLPLPQERMELCSPWVTSLLYLSLVVPPSPPLNLWGLGTPLCGCAKNPREWDNMTNSKGIIITTPPKKTPTKNQLKNPKPVEFHAWSDKECLDVTSKPWC